MKRLAVISLCLFFQAEVFFSWQPSQEWYSPYFLKANHAYLSLGCDTAVLNGAALIMPGLSLDYGIADRVEAGLDFHYTLLTGAGDGGRLGDLKANVKLLLAEPVDLSWRVSTQIDLRFPTGVQASDADRMVNGRQLSYFPYSSGTSGISAAVLASWFPELVMLTLSMGYCSESGADEGIFQFNAARDRLFGQLTADYHFKLKLDGETTLAFRPALTLDYQYNLSTDFYRPDGLTIGAEWNTRLGDWKSTLAATMPVFFKPYLCSFSLIVGRYF